MSKGAKRKAKRQAGAAQPAAQATPRRRRRPASSDNKTHRIRYGAHGQEIVAFSGKSVGYGSREAINTSGRSVAVTASSDAHARYDLEDLRAESNRLDRDNCIYQAAISRVCDFIVGPGWSLQARTSDPAINKLIEKKWAKFWRRPEVRQLDSGAQVEYMICRQRLVDGDGLELFHPGNEHFQLIPGELIYSSHTRAANGNRIEGGVELDAMRRPVRFHIGQYGPEGYSVRNGEPIATERAHYFACRRRIDQTRGEPALQCIFPMIHRVNDICDSEAAAWQLLSRIAIAISRKESNKAAFDSSAADEELSGDERTRALAERVHDLGHSLIFHHEPGEEVKGIDRNIPGANFVESLKMFLRLIGLPLGMSLEFILLIWSDTNYSSGRASIKQVERNCKPHIEAQGDSLSAVYDWKVTQWVAAGELPSLSDILKHEWHVPPYPFIDPEKEAKGETEELRNGGTTPTRVAKARGQELSDLVIERTKDFGLIAAAVAKHNTDHPDQPVTMADYTAAVQSAETPEASAPPASAAPTEAASTDAPPTEAASKNIVAGEKLNGAQITAAKDLVSDFAAGLINEVVAFELLVAVGIEEDKVRRMVDATKQQIREQVAAAQPKEEPAV